MKEKRFGCIWELSDLRQSFAFGIRLIPMTVFKAFELYERPILKIEQQICHVWGVNNIIRSKVQLSVVHQMNLFYVLENTELDLVIVYGYVPPLFNCKMISQRATESWGAKVKHFYWLMKHDLPFKNKKNVFSQGIVCWPCEQARTVNTHHTTQFPSSF